MTIFEQVRSYIEAPEPARFESLALTVFRYQAEHVPVYRTYLASLDIEPFAVRSLNEIPPVSTLAYKYARIENELHPLSPTSRVFLTSGTTIGRDERGRHIVPEPTIYRAAATRHLRRMMFPDGACMTMLALHPTAGRMPESSLAQMISWCIDEFGDGDASCVATPQSVDTAQATDFLLAAERLNRPVCILGTTASCAALFTALRQNNITISLPAGSRLMDTGGAKGQRIPLSPEQVAADAHELLGIQPPLVINEYGMTEMCSQLYDATSFNSGFEGSPGMRMKLAPPWLSPAALDPITLKPNTGGQPGLLAFFDLANVGSISALMTEDVGIVHGNAVIVLGRAAKADRRGCALAIQQFAESGESLPSLQPRRISGHNVSVLGEPAQTAPAEGADLLRTRAPEASEIHAAASRLRRTFATTPSSTNPHTIGAIFHEVMVEVTGSQRWQQANHEVAAKSGYSESLLNLSLRALVRPLHEAAELARRVRPRRELLGFIMPGNLPGAGLHELVIALAAGCAAIVKTSSSEPVFFSELATTLRKLDSRFGSDLGARLEVFNWARECSGLTDALLKNCDRVIAFGDDVTILQLEELVQHGRLLAFGNRFSGAAVMREAVQGIAMAQTAEALALDCAMFNQRGCLSPRHIFVEEHAREFAAHVAAAFSGLAPLFGGSGALRALELEDAATIRRVRETARWRRLGGSDVEFWEDCNLQWTVIFDPSASFTPSPGFCTVYVSPFSDPSDLERRLEPVYGRLEAFAIAGGDSGADAGIGTLHTNGFAEPPGLQAVCTVVGRCGATYVCAPGEMQSPPLDWPHGGGEFIRMFIS
jgi:Acyl-CoA reductase (LuxC)/Acyl-protein synthetase, LuxE